MSKSLISGIGAACLHLALSAGALSAVNASPSYYRARRGAYGAGSRQYLADPGMRQLSATTFSKGAKSLKVKGNSPSKFSDFHFQKNQAVRELVIVDGNVQDKHLILNQVKPGLDVVEVNPGLAGMEALTSILKNYKALDAVHIVSHAEAGVLHIGGTKVNQEALQRHIADFSIVNEAIREGGDLLLYGCDLAKGESGEEFLEVIRKNTHVDVAASVDKTGNVQFGGDWELEVSKGDIDAAPLPGSLALKDFTGTLQFSGTIDFSQVKNAGDYIGGNPAVNAEFWESAYRDHVLIVDGATGPTYTFGDYASFGAYYLETSVVLRFAANETFDPKSITLFNWAGGSIKYTVTSDKGGQVVSGNLSGIGQAPLDISTLPAGTSTLTITSDGAFWGAVEDLAVDNLQVPSANTAPVASAVSFSGTRVVGETLTGSYTFTDADGDAESGSTYKWYRSDDASGTGKAAISAATSKTYTLQVADQGKYLSFEVTPGDGSVSGTTVESNIQGPVSAALKATIASQTNIACNGGATGSITSSGSGGTGPYTYSWAPSGGSAATASGLAAGTYTVTVTDTNGKTATANTTITQPGALAATTSQTNVSCNGGSNGSASVSVSGGTSGYTYSWAPSGGTAATATGLSAGTYTVTITDANACQITKSFTITQPAAITATTSQTNVSCNGGSNGSASVSVSGGTSGYTYSWAPSGGTAATASGLSAGTYTVTITDANACQITKSFTITQPAALSATTSQTNISCNGGSNGSASVSVSGGTSGYTYSWAPSGGTAATASGLSAGTYTVTITDANDCQITKSFTITQPAALSATTSQTNISCNGGSNGSASVSVSGGTSGYTYSWAPSGGTAATATGLSAGTYTVTITDANDCQITKSFTITQPAALSATTSQTNVSCNGGSNGSASVSVSGGTSGYTYSWAPSGGTAATATGLSAGTYTVTITDANDCQITKSFTITQPAALLATTSQANVSCNGGSNGSASVSVSGGTSSYTYSWAPSGGTAATATGLSAGTYTVTITDANACQITKSFTITQPAALSATTSQTNISCNGGSNGSASVSVSGGTSGYTYSWAPSGGTAATATGLSAGTYTVTITDANDCQITKSFTITQPAALLATTSQTNVSCNGGSNGSASVSVSGGTSGYTYSWAPSGGTAATATGLSAGTYTVTITDANACQITKSFTITQPATLLATSTTTDITSRGGTDGTATVTASGGASPYTYNWAPSGGADATATGLAAGTYTCTITDANDCQTTEQVTLVETNTAPAASAVSISGIMTTGQTLTGNYTYADTDGDAESGSTFKWYRSTDASGTGRTPIIGATGITYTLAGDDEDTFISFEVTPNDGISSGTPAESPRRGPVSPTLSATISMNDANLLAGETALVTINFNKAVTAFSNADVTAVNGNLSTVSTSDGGVTWTATFTPDPGVEHATNTLGLDLTALTDSDGIAGTGVASSANFTIDTRRPVATVTLFDQALRAGETATVTFIFNEWVTGFSEADIAADNGTVSALSTSDGITWTAILTPVAGAEELVNRITIDQSGVTDAAGNAGSGTIDSDHYTVDTLIPDAPGTPDLDAISDTGDSDADNLTNDATPLLRGDAEANSIVALSDQATVLGTVTADAQGKWMLQMSTPLSEGTHQFTAVATDAAGNVSTSSPVLAIILDTTPPVTPPTADLDAGSDSGASNTDNITSDATPVLSGTAEASANVIIRSDLDGLLGPVRTNGSGVWVFTSPVLTQGIHALTCIAVDAAGNESAASPTLGVRIDTESPAVTHLADQTIPLHGNTGNLPLSVVDNLTPAGELTVEAATSNPAITPVLGGTGTDHFVYVTGVESGAATITITVTDLAGNQGTGTFTVNVNSSPAITGSPSSHVSQDVQYNFVPFASDPDEGDELTFSIQNKPPWAIFNTATGALTGTPAREDVGVTNDIVITVSDGTASSALEAFAIEVIYVNALPADILLSSAEVEENQPAGMLVGMFSSVDPDEDNAHSYTFVTGAGSADNTLFYIDGHELFAQTNFDSEVRDTYHIRVQTNDGDGGVLEKAFEIRVKDVEDSRVFIPNLFSPNGDGSNETFRVRANGITEVVFRIFNRWGEMVYETSDIEEATETGWDGNHQGKEQPSGTYLWQLNGRFTDAAPVLFEGKNTGNITLIR